MKHISFEVLKPSDHVAFQLIASWYLSEWKIPVEKTLQKLKIVTEDSSQAQMLMRINETPVSCAGLYHHVGLLEKEPRFSIHKNWLGLVYTVPTERQKGYGALICNNIEEQAKKMGTDQLYLFTDTAERLYRRLGWSETERLKFGERNIVVMKKDL